MRAGDGEVHQSGAPGYEFKLRRLGDGPGGGGAPGSNIDLGKEAIGRGVWGRQHRRPSFVKLGNCPIPWLTPALRSSSVVKAT